MTSDAYTASYLDFAGASNLMIHENSSQPSQCGVRSSETHCFAIEMLLFGRMAAAPDPGSVCFVMLCRLCNVHVAQCTKMIRACRFLCEQRIVLTRTYGVRFVVDVDLTRIQHSGNTIALDRPCVHSSGCADGAKENTSNPSFFLI